MHRFVMLIVLLCLLVPPPALAAPLDGPGSFPPHTEWGTPVAVGNGQIQTFVTVVPSGEPQSLGVYFSASMLEGLPQHPPSDGRWDVLYGDGQIWYCCGYETVLDFPPSGAATPFQHFVLNWNPHGHIPPGLYDLPHFDFHFYTISNQERTSITKGTCEGEPPLDCPSRAKALTPVPSDHLPPGYQSVGAVEPGMGDHLLDLSSPEFNGEPFTKTWIYGAYEGRITFFEPMITKQLLEEKQVQDCTSLSMPQAFAAPGWYPTRYCIRYIQQADAYAISLEEFKLFPGSGNP